MKRKFDSKKAVMLLAVWVVCCVSVLLLSPNKLTAHAASSLFLGNYESSFSGSANSGSFYIYCDPGTCWTAYVPSGSWIRLSKNGGYGNDKITFTVAANVSGSTRTGKIIVRTCEAAGTVREYTVTQSSEKVTISLYANDNFLNCGIFKNIRIKDTSKQIESPRYIFLGNSLYYDIWLKIGFEAGFCVDVTSNVTWIASADVDWIKFDSIYAGDAGKTRLLFSIPAGRVTAMNNVGHIYFYYNGTCYAQIELIRDDIIQ